MPDTFDATGLQVKTLPEILSSLITSMQAIYGADINVDQNSPDGQMLNIFAQAGVDIRELLVQINAGFDPDQAIGAVLDQRVPINLIARRGGTFTIVPIDITVDRTVTLQGLDSAFNNVNGTGYTLQDDAGNMFILIDTVTLTAGTSTHNFRAQQLGLVETVVDTIQNPVTIVLGVNTVNNSTGSLSVGEAEETDAQLRTRRQQSVAINSQGYGNGLEGQALALTGVSQAKLFQNRGDTVDSNGIPAHGMWLIVEDGASSDIANVIYNSINYGANMKGAVSTLITTPSGDVVDILFDRPTAEPLWIKFNIKKTVSTAVFSTIAIAAYIEDNLLYQINQYAETSSITAVALMAIMTNGGNGVPVDVFISTDNVTYVDFINTATLDKQFTVDTSRILITVI